MKNNLDSTPYTYQIHYKSNLLCILTVISHFFFIGDTVPPVHLSQSGQTRTDVICTISLPCLINIILILQKRTRSYKRHLSCQNIEKLRELVYGSPPEDASRFSDIVFRVLKQVRRQIVRGIGFHCAEFQYIEVLPVALYVFTDSSLAKKAGFPS